MCLYQRSLGELARVLPAVTSFCRDHGANAAETFACELAAEELFTNFVRHNRGGGDHIRLELRMTGAFLTIEFTDFDVDPFDPAQAPAVDITAPVEQRRPGGLGLYLVRTYMDDVRYECSQRTMRVTATKRLEAGDVRHQAR